MRIVGDPAWLQQGEVTNGIDAAQFTFSAFNSDGSINFDSQEVLFDVSWNQPQDYDFDTGVMNVNNQNGRSKQNNTYRAIECRSFFSRGKFEQELMGKQFVEFKKTATPAQATEVRPQPTKPSPVRTAPVASATGIVASAEAQYRAGNNVFGNKLRGVKTYVGPKPGPNQ
jgi:hypothetical protein